MLTRIYWLVYGFKWLIENNDVSHFRLSVHLTLALFILCLIFWFILDLFNIKKFKIKII